MAEKATIQERARDVVEEFNLFDDWMGKYEYLIELGNSLPPIEDEYKTDDYKIKGCQSQVWIRPETADGLVFYKGDSDALITKGLVALLVRVLSGQPPEAVAEADLSFLDEIGMKEHLSSTRKNGLASMVKQLKLYALAHTQKAHH
ncbi:MAG: SufE family protein [Rhodothermales bacterium]